MKSLSLRLAFILVIITGDSCTQTDISTHYKEVNITDFTKIEQFDSLPVNEKLIPSAISFFLTGTIGSDITISFFRRTTAGQPVLIHTRIFPKGVYDGHTEYRPDYYLKENIIMEIKPTIPMTGNLKIKWGIV